MWTVLTKGLSVGELVITLFVSNFYLFGLQVKPFRDTKEGSTKGEYIYPAWWCFPVHFKSKSKTIVCAWYLSSILHALANFFFLINKVDAFFISIVLCFSSSSLYMLLKATTLPCEIRNHTWFKLIIGLSTLFLLATPLVLYILINDSFSNTFELVNSNSFFLFGALNSLNYFLCMFLFIYPLLLSCKLRRNQDDLKPRIYETVLHAVVILGSLLVVRWICIFYENMSLLALISLKVECSMFSWLSFVNTRWGWRRLSDKNKERSKRATSAHNHRVMLANTQAINEAMAEELKRCSITTIDLEIPQDEEMMLLELEPCLFPTRVASHRRASTMVEIYHVGRRPQTV